MISFIFWVTFKKVLQIFTNLQMPNIFFEQLNKFIKISFDGTAKKKTQEYF